MTGYPPTRVIHEIFDAAAVSLRAQTGREFHLTYTIEDGVGTLRAVRDDGYHAAYSMLPGPEAPRLVRADGERIGGDDTTPEERARLWFRYHVEDAVESFVNGHNHEAGRASGMPTLEEQVQHLGLFLAAADDRLRKAQAEAAAAKREAADMRAAWVRAVGGRLLFRPDLLTALEETTTDMRLHLDELAEEDAKAELVAMEAEYGPHVSVVIEEDA